MDNVNNIVSEALEKAKNPKWDKPDMALVNRKVAPPPAFPSRLFANKWADWLKHAAACKNAPVDYVALALMVGTAGMLGNTRSFEAWDGWIEPCILWGAVVGNPSSGKSPALDTVVQAMHEIESMVHEENKRLMAEYREKLYTQKIIKSAWESQCKTAIKNGEEPPPQPDGLQSIPMPLQRHFIISDTTVEKAADILANNDRGITIQRDELAGLLTNFEKYGGDDRTFYLESYGGRARTIHRVKHPEGHRIAYVPRMSTSEYARTRKTVPNTAAIVYSKCKLRLTAPIKPRSHVCKIRKNKIVAPIIGQRNWPWVLATAFGSRRAAKPKTQSIV